MTDRLTLTLLAHAAAARLARTPISQHIVQWELDHRLDDVLLVASELINNACEAAPGSRIKVRLSRNGQGILVSVWDPADALPRSEPVTELTPETLDTSTRVWDNGGGWGLPLVQALSSTHGHHPTPSGGKWIWASIDV